MKILPVLTAALLLCSCAADRETEALKNSLSEAQTVVRLSQAAGAGRPAVDHEGGDSAHLPGPQ